MSSRCRGGVVLAAAACVAAGTVIPCGIPVSEGRVASGIVGGASGGTCQVLSVSGTSGPVIDTGGTGLGGAVSSRVGRRGRGGPSGFVDARGHGLVSTGSGIDVRVAGETVGLAASGDGAGTTVGADLQ